MFVDRFELVHVLHPYKMYKHTHTFTLPIPCLIDRTHFTSSTELKLLAQWLTTLDWRRRLTGLSLRMTALKHLIPEIRQHEQQNQHNALGRWCKSAKSIKAKLACTVYTHTHLIWHDKKRFDYCTNVKNSFKMCLSPSQCRVNCASKDQLGPLCMLYIYIINLTSFIFMARQNNTFRFIAKRPALVGSSSILWTQQSQQRHTQKNMCSHRAHLVCSIDVSAHAMHEPVPRCSSCSGSVPALACLLVTWAEPVWEMIPHMLLRYHRSVQSTPGLVCTVRT